MMLPLFRMTPMCLFLAVLVLRADTRGSVRQADVDKQLRELEKAIEKVRELKFKTPVVAHVIPRGKAAAGLQGYYDTKKKALFLYDDVKGNYAKGVLVHEMAHALQDQHFGLAKLHQASFGSDAELALAALIEGDATLTMIEVLGKASHADKMLSVPLDRSKNLQNAFLYAQGARWVQAMKKRGGWKLVNQRYQFPPTTTAVVLHPDERISPVELGPGKRIGEYGIIEMLRGQPATAAGAVQAASGWRGDRVIDEEAGKAWVVAFATPEQAARFHEALGDLRKAEYPKQEIVRDVKGERTWKLSGGGKRAVLLRDRRVWEITAKEEKGYRPLLDRLEGPPRLSIHASGDRKTLAFGEFVDRLMEGDLICIGETHDSETHHVVQLMLIKALFARDERLGVGMEMFQRPYQKIVDRYFSGAIDEKTFLEDTEYQKRWGFEWTLYRPIVEFCKRNHVPLAALNVSTELRGQLSKLGYDKLSAEEKKQLGEIDFQVKEHRAYWFERLGQMHGHGKPTREGKEKMYQVMTTWDEYMADSAARFQKERKLRRMVILAGSGHIERGFGIPARAARRTGGKALTVRILVGGDLAKVAADPAADFVVLVR